jgi:hypothetical protein
MTKEQKQLIIIGFLLIIFLAVLINAIASANKKKLPAPAPAPAVEVPSAEEPALGSAKGQAIQAEGVSSAAKKASADETWGRDPFGDTTKHEIAVFEFKLQGITYANGTGFAFINNDIVKKGDRLGDYTVAEIYKDKVLLKKGEQEQYLRFPEE